jgi:hypothetical protein
VTFRSKVDDYVRAKRPKDSGEVVIGDIESDVLDPGCRNTGQPTVVTGIRIEVDVQYLCLGGLNRANKARTDKAESARNNDSLKNIGPSEFPIRR